MTDHTDSDTWADHINEAYYDKMGADFGRRTRDRINWMASQAEGASILDVGCSQGITSILLAREGLQALGIDIFPQAIEYAERERLAEIQAVQQRLSFECVDIAALDADRLFDTVIAGEVLEHQTNPKRFLLQAAAHVGPGGRLVITTPYGLHPWPDHKCTVFPADIVDILGEEFGILCLEVTDGYIRCVAGKAGGNRDADALARMALSASREGSISIQRELYAARASAEKSVASLLAMQGQVQAAEAKARTAHEALHEMELKRLTEEKGRELAEKDRKIAESQLELVNQAHSIEVQRSLESEKAETELRANLDKAEAALREAQQKRSNHWNQLVKERNYSMLLADTVEGLHRDNEMYRTSVALALGRAILAARRPRGLIALPRAIYAALRLPSRRAAGLVPALPSPLEGLREAADSEPRLTAQPYSRHVPSAAAEVPLSVAGWRQQLVPGKARVLSVLDEFSRSCFAPHANLIEPRPDNWKPLAEAYRPDFALIESSWRGNDSSWQYRIADYANPPGQELGELLDDFRRKGIPTVFWNKEDPVHFDNFIENASKFDFVFTTAEEAVEKYQERTQARVEVLPFAAEISLHNPIGSATRNERVCFAGSFYANRFQDRQADQLMLLDAASRFDLDIYDRNYGAAGTTSSDFSFPERFSPFIRGRLPYAEMNRAYRRYRIFLNVNSVVESPTMFSRRVFELLACGTPVVSTWSKGVEEMLGDACVWSVKTREEAEHAIRTLLENDEEWRKRSLAGMRAVMAKHTYAHRFEKVLNVLGLGDRTTVEAPRLLVVGEARTQEEVSRLIASFDAQQGEGYRADMAILVRSADLAKPDHPAIFVSEPAVPLSAFAESLVRDAESTHVSIFDPQALYGKYFLNDSLNAARYSRAQVVGKAANGADLYAYGAEIHPMSRIFDLRGLSELGIGLVQAIDEAESLTGLGARAFAADSANFASPGRPLSPVERERALAQIEI